MPTYGPNSMDDRFFVGSNLLFADRRDIPTRIDSVQHVLIFGTQGDFS